MWHSCIELVWESVLLGRGCILWYWSCVILFCVWWCIVMEFSLVYLHKLILFMKLTVKLKWWTLYELGPWTFHTISVHICHLQCLRLYNWSLTFPLLPAVLVILVLTFLIYMMLLIHNGRHHTCCKCCIRNFGIVWQCLTNTSCKKLRSQTWGLLSAVCT